MNDFKLYTEYYYKLWCHLKNIRFIIDIYYSIHARHMYGQIRNSIHERKKCFLISVDIQ